MTEQIQKVNEQKSSRQWKAPTSRSHIHTKSRRLLYVGALKRELRICPWGFPAHTKKSEIKERKGRMCCKFTWPASDFSSYLHSQPFDINHGRARDHVDGKNTTTKNNLFTTKWFPSSPWVAFIFHERNAFVCGCCVWMGNKEPLRECCKDSTSCFAFIFLQDLLDLFSIITM